MVSVKTGAAENSSIWCGSIMIEPVDLENADVDLRVVNVVACLCNPFTVASWTISFEVNRDRRFPLVGVEAVV